MPDPRTSEIFGRALTEEYAATSPDVVDHVNYEWLCTCGHICSGDLRTIFGMTGR
jgi:hypothetical protein